MHELTCRLCQKPAVLQKSHVISEFLYTSVYDENHRFLQVSTDPTVRTVPRPKGLYERLLCAPCEGRRGRWESYAAKVLKGGVELQVQNESWGFLFNGVDYSVFKLFGLSLLWLASISSRAEFLDVQLGPHEEVLRRMLLDENPGRQWEYGFTIAFPPERTAQTTFGQILIAPERVPHGGRSLYRFFFGVTSWVFLVSRRLRPGDENKSSLFEDGRLRVLNGGKPMMDFLNRLSEDFSAANSARTHQ